MSRTKRPKKKSKSEELRGVFYALFNKDDEDFESFELYYDSKMSKLIKHYRKLL